MAMKELDEIFNVLVKLQGEENNWKDSLNIIQQNLNENSYNSPTLILNRIICEYHILSSLNNTEPSKSEELGKKAISISQHLEGFEQNACIIFSILCFSKISEFDLPKKFLLYLDQIIESPFDLPGIATFAKNFVLEFKDLTPILNAIDQIIKRGECNTDELKYIKSIKSKYLEYQKSLNK